MANRLANPVPHFTDDSGEPLSGGFLWSYVTGTTTKTSTYSDSALTTPNTNPIVLNSRGEPDTDIFLDPAVTYKFVLARPTDTTDPPSDPIWTRNTVADFAANVTAAFQIYNGNPNGNVAGTAGTLGGAGASVIWDITNQLFYVCTTSGDAASAVWTQATGVLSGALLQTGDVTPTALSANTNNWNPGASAASIIRASSTADYSVTGIKAASDGTLYTIINIGSNKITLKRETTSTAANRLALPSDVELLPNMAITLRYDGTSSRWRPMDRATRELPPGWLYGCTLSNNSGDATNDIDIAAGQARDSSDEIDIVLASGLTKQLDAGWAAGTNQGMRNSGAAITNTTYHIYAVCKAGGADADIYAHTSATVATVLTALQAETGGADYIYARRIGSIVRTSGAIVQFSQNGDRFVVTPINSVNTAAPGTSAVTATLDIPTGIVVDAIITFTVDGSTGSEVYGLVSALTQSNQAPSATVHSVFLEAGVEAAGSVHAEIPTDTSAQIRYRLSASVQATITTLGWIDRRGRDG